MHIAIVGGSQGTGAALAVIAQEQGHDVTVISRSGNAPHGAKVVKGDASNSDVVKDAIAGTDAVVVTVGGAKGADKPRTQITKAVIEAMKDSGPRRLIIQSSLAAGDSTQQLPPLLRAITPLMLAKPLADHNDQEAAVQASDLDWTIVRPAGLKDAPSKGSWKALTVDEQGTLSGTVPRADVAKFMLEALANDDTIHKAYGVSS